MITKIQKSSFKSHKNNQEISVDLKLKAKRALVTGASKGIGKSCAMVLAQEGCEVLRRDVDLRGNPYLGR